DCTLCGPPADQGQVCAAWSMYLELEGLRDLTGGRLQLGHPLAHHRDPVLDTFGDVAFRVMLIARGREDAACRPRERARADAIRRDGVPPVAMFLGADRLVHQTAVDPQVAGVEPVGCEQGGG